MKNRVKASEMAVVIISLLFLAASLTIAPLSELTISSDAAYPIFISVLCVVFAVWIVVEERKKKNAAAENTQEKFLNKDVMVLIGVMALYALLLFLLGYVLSTLIFTVLSTTYLYKRNWRMGLVVGFISTFMIVLVFKYGFNVILP